MSELSKLLESTLPAANPANLANPRAEISTISNFSRGAVPKRQFVGRQRLRILAGADWPEISDDPKQLEAFKTAAETAEQIRLGLVPDHYTSTTECKRCGPVPIFEGCSPQVEGCPWCLNRHAGLPMPVTTGESNDKRKE